MIFIRLYLLNLQKKFFMAQLPTLVNDLALILISAGIITLLFRLLKQPLVLGYIVAGILIGPHIDIFPTVVDASSVEIWAEIGVIFLLFALGLEFSLKRLINVGRSALITAGTELFFMICVGFIVGQLLGWGLIDSFFLGAMMSTSSTTIIIKTIDEMGLKNQKFASIVFGTLIVDDMIAVIMMVVVSTMAVRKQFEGTEMLMSLVRLIFFLVIWFVVWIYVLPTFFKKVKRWLNDETLLIISIGLCLLMVVLATKSGFSSALGAFLVGSILAETLEGERIEKLVTQIKNLFGAIFFVSVGMIIDPTIIVNHIWTILILAAVVIVFKSFSAFLGSMISGQLLKTSIQVGCSLSQIGEFAFILASLGYSLGVLSEVIYPIIVVVSVITIFVTPYAIKTSTPIYNFIYPRLSDKTKNFLERYSEGTSIANTNNGWKTFLKHYITRILVFAVVLVTIILLSNNYLHPFITEKLEIKYGNLIYAAITITLCSPFIRGMMSNKKSDNEIVIQLWDNNRYNRGGLLSLLIFRIILSTAFIIMILYKAFNSFVWFTIPIAVAVLTLFAFSRRSKKRYSKIEKHFVANLNQKEEENRKKNPLKSSIAEQLSDRDIHLARVQVSPDSKYIGIELAKTDIRSKHGVYIVKIERGNRTINLPSGSDCVYPFDSLIVIGTDTQISSFTQEIEQEANTVTSKQDMLLKSFIIEKSSDLINKTILTCGIRERTGCLIVGIERDGNSYMNPPAKTEFEEGDLVWVVGEKTQVNKLLKETL